MGRTKKPKRCACKGTPNCGGVQTQANAFRRWYLTDVVSREAEIEMVVFDSCSKALADKREEFWIRRALHFNHRLTNRTHGNLILSLWGADHFLFGQFFPVQEVPVEKLLEFWIRSWDEYRATEKSTNAWGLEVLATEQGAIDQLNDMVRKLPGRYPLFNRREVKV